VGARLLGALAAVALGGASIAVAHGAGVGGIRSPFELANRVVAEEDVDGPGRLVEGPPEWLEPIVHGADGPTRRRMVISSIL
jgi:hypothetical protein